VVAVTLMMPTGAIAQEFDECGFLLPAEGPWEDVQDCLLFQSDSGTVYQLNVLSAQYVAYTPGNRARVYSYNPQGCDPTCPGAQSCINSARIAPCYATVGHFTTAVDFQQGEFINLNADNDRLQVNTWEQTKTADPREDEKNIFS